MRRGGPPSNLELANHLAEVMARRYAQAFDQRIGLVDLTNFAKTGAADALARWNGHGRFEPFAVQRIRWAILTGARRWMLQQRSPASLRAEHALYAAERTADSVDETPEELEMAPRELADQSATRYRLELRVSEEEAARMADPEGDPEHAAERLQLRRAVAALPPPEDAVVMRHTYQRESFQDIADDLALAKSTVADAYRRGVRRLQEQFDPPPPPSAPPPAPVPLRRAMAAAGP